MAAGEREVGQGLFIETGIAMANASISSTYGDTAFVDNCPDSIGRVPGEYSFRSARTVSGTAHGRKVVSSLDTRFVARLLGHVSANGRLATFEYQADATAKVQASELVAATGKVLRHEPTRVYRWHFSRSGAARSGSSAGLQGLNATFRGPKGARISGAAREAALALLAQAIAWIESAAQSRFLEAEKNWYGDPERLGENSFGNCTDVLITSDKSKLGRGEQATATVSVKARKDLRETSARLTVRGCPGTVAPTTGTFTPANPIDFSYTSDDAAPLGGGCLDVKTVGVTGRAEQSFTWSASRFVDITFEGTGSWADVATLTCCQRDVAQDSIAFAWKRVYRDVPITAAEPNSYLPSTDQSSGTYTGQGMRNQTGESWHCTSPIRDQSVRSVSVFPGDGTYSIVLGDLRFFPDLNARTCTGTPRAGGYGTSNQRDGALLTARLTLSQADLERPDIRRTVGYSGALPPNCGGAYSEPLWSCAGTLSWSGTVTLSPAD